MRLHVTGHYRNGTLGVEYQEGQVIDVKDAEAEFLLRDSPGSFSTSAKKHEAPAETENAPAESPTETGIDDAKDRRARGGRNR